LNDVHVVSRASITQDYWGDIKEDWVSGERKYGSRPVGSNNQPVKKKYTDLKCSADSNGSRPRERIQVKFSVIKIKL